MRRSRDIYPHPILFAIVAVNYSRDSDQSKSDSGILQLMEDLGGAINSGGEIQMLGGGNPATIPEVEKVFRGEMERILADDRKFEHMIGNYDSPQGNHAFVEALADLLCERFGWPIGPANIAITNGSQAAFGVLFNSFAGRYPNGAPKKILLPMAPEYIGYTDVGLGDEPLFTANRPIIENIDELFFKYRVDFDRLRIDEQIGAVCVSRPTNPTGNVITDDEIAKLQQLTKKAGVPLIVDGAYGLPFPAIVFNRAQPSWDDHVILCLSLSKLGLPGVRTGMVIANPDVIAQITRANAIFTLAPGRFGPTLVTRLLQSRELLSLCEEAIVPYYHARCREAINLVRELMRDLPVRVHSSEGAFFLWLCFPGMPITSETLYQRLKQRGVLVIAGRHFFPGFDEPWAHRDECIRVTYTADPAQVKRGLEIIAQEVRRGYAEQN